MSKKLLIACYFFPPCPSIGGRRSAKFAKYLAKKGDEVYVIQANYPFAGQSPWLKDIENERKIHRYELPLKYPKEFIVAPTTLIGKLRYRLFSYYFKLFYPNKNRFDYTIFWEKQFLNLAETLIRKHEIKNILVSGPPFYYAHQIVKLKEKLPDLNIIIDFRDPWIGSPYYGMSDLKQKQQNFEIALLNDVYKKSDYFTAPNTFLLNEQKAFVKDLEGKGAQLVELSHAFDKEEMPLVEITAKRNDGKIKLVYGGQFYPGTDSILVALAKLLDEMKSKSIEIYSLLRFDMYCPEQDRMRFFKGHEKVVFFHKPVGNEIMNKIMESDFCLIFLAAHNKDYKTTKFLEYSALRKPFVVFGDKGYVAKFVEENRLGAAFDADTMKGFSTFIENAHAFFTSGYNRNFDLSEYSFETVTDKLRTLLK